MEANSVPDVPAPTPVVEPSPVNRRAVLPEYVGGPLDGVGISDDAFLSTTTRIAHAPEEFTIGADTGQAMPSALTFYIPYELEFFGVKVTAWVPELEADREGILQRRIARAIIRRATQEV